MPLSNHNTSFFDKKLILQQWMFDCLGVKAFDTLKAWLTEENLDGFDEENISNFYAVLAAHLVNPRHFTKEDLLRYDTNIVRAWQHITERRNRAEGRKLFPKYFQYLALLAGEIYLERYFNDKEALLKSLNNQVAIFNEEKSIPECIQRFEESDLNKIAFWMATGSGKTLLMHCNLLQFQYYLNLHKESTSINHILLLTPNEGLSLQHLRELELSNIPAELFQKQSMSGLRIGTSGVEIIDIHKLSERSGPDTVAVDAFERNNLVLVDEGHSGASSGEEGVWMQRREALCEQGFSFEYSATFGQAIKKDSALEQTYAKSILFDYSYRHFHDDGYGKEYLILNLRDDQQEDQRYRYLCACLLSFYQQQKVYQQKIALTQEYLLERPLWIFVGGSVKAVYARNKRKVSDVLDILLFLARFTDPQNRSLNETILRDFLQGNAGLLDNQGKDIFSESFQFLQAQAWNEQQVYSDILKILFNSDGCAKLRVENIKGSDGEIGLKLGEQLYFGLINVGDAPELRKLCEQQPELLVSENVMQNSIFQQLENRDSTIHILIGARKFMEGWNSWRVSTMGLMNIGRGEGSQIIQLFGRGVRLKGKNFSLKRSTAMNGGNSPRYLALLEKLNIFGVHADYMQQFKEYLQTEGISTEVETTEFILPVVYSLGKQKLKIPRLPKGLDFIHDGPILNLDLPDEALQHKPVVINWYPHVQALSSVVHENVENELYCTHLTPQNISFINKQELYFDVCAYKEERGWHNLTIQPEKLIVFFNEPSWYKLYIPEEQLNLSSYQKVNQWQEIASALLRTYCDRFYKWEKARWESERLEYQELTSTDDNFIKEYRILYEKSQEEICQRLEVLKEAIMRGDLRNVQFHNLEAICFEKHLYQPLFYLGENSQIVVSPVALNQGEKVFIEDLQTYSKEHTDFFNEKELYLLRNRSKGKGVGFFEAGNFYPDFILWLVDGNMQYISFIDPKGIGRLGLADLKVEFYQNIKGLQNGIGDKEVILNSFILSNTEFNDLPIQIEGMRREDWEVKHVFFQKDDRKGYIHKMIDKIFG
jgi:hypothetical protein